jgi:hypothetical protein
MMSQPALNTLMIGATILMFLIALAINELLFTRLEFAPGINWIYLPAGVRLLSTLLFAEAGAIGLLLVSWAVCFFYFFPNDPVRSFMGGILASASPYLVYCGMRRYFGLQAALTNLTTAKLMICACILDRQPPLPSSLVRPVRGQDGPAPQFPGHGNRRFLRHRDRSLRSKIHPWTVRAGTQLKRHCGGRARQRQAGSAWPRQTRSTRPPPLHP